MAFHLVRRFVGYLGASAPTDEELESVRGELSPELFTLFQTMTHQDQRHSIDVASRVEGQELTEAALLHDVGKSVAPLGAIARSIATILNAVSFPVSGSWGLYLRHGEIGASMLEDADASTIAVAFARFHPGPPPPGIAHDDWVALEEADDL